MQVRGKLTANDLAMASRMNRPKLWWARHIVGDLSAPIFAFALGYVTVAKIFFDTSETWTEVWLVWLVVGVWIWISTRLGRRESAKKLAELNAKLPQAMSIESNGLQLNYEGGTPRVVPWNTFGAWREGQGLVGLFHARKNGFSILPVAELSPVEMEVLRGLLHSHLGEPRPRSIWEKITPRYC